MKTTITQQQLKEQVSYDEHTGIFTRIKRTRGQAAGTILNRTNDNGYILIGLNHKVYRAHQLAFLYMNGAMPLHQVDHRNHIRDDNRWINIRLATNAENTKNKILHPLNKSGFNGVMWHKEHQIWYSQITVKRKTIFLGYFKDKNEAICARLHANRLYKFHANHGKPL